MKRRERTRVRKTGKKGSIKTSCAGNDKKIKGGKRKTKKKNEEEKEEKNKEESGRRAK